MLSVELPNITTVFADNRTYSHNTDDYSDSDPDRLNSFVEQESFSDYLHSQLRLLDLPDKRFASLCSYIIDCLRSSGYLDMPLSEIAASFGASLFDTEQALYVIQELDPPGVGARSLSECLLIQLSKGRHFNALNIHMIRTGLELLAVNDYKKLAAKYRVGIDEVRMSATVIRSMNPIPSQGFFSGQPEEYTVPEANVRVEDGQILVELNSSAFPKVSFDQYYLSMLGNDVYPDIQDYLKNMHSEASKIVSAVNRREETIQRIITAIITYQQDYFLKGEPIKPLMMTDLASQLDMNVSTVSRAVKDKYILFKCRPIQLRMFFSTPVSAAFPDASAEIVKQHIKRFLAAEDKHSPLTDDKLAEALKIIGFPVSRRTVAKYRSELNIPPSSARKL